MRRLLVCIALVLIAFGLWSVLDVDAASRLPQEQAKQAAVAKQTAPMSKSALHAQAEYVGQETCEACHDDLSKKFSSNPHSRLAMMHGGKGATCESCHGPGKAHSEDPSDPTKIFRFTTASAKQVDETCLGCHVKSHPEFKSSAHAKANVSCTNCHSVHSFKEDAALLKASQPTLCYGCHTDVKPAFSQPFHHKVNEGLLTCSDCHNPHGTSQAKMLKSTHEQNAVCTKCHTETAGPFVFEHPVLKTEGCVSCHTPHGSPNPRLLNVAHVNTLCLQCHSGLNTGAFPAAKSPSGPAHNQATQYVACTNCHTQIHGSNASDVFFK